MCTAIYQLRGRGTREERDQLSSSPPLSPPPNRLSSWQARPSLRYSVAKEGTLGLTIVDKHGRAVLEDARPDVREAGSRVRPQVYLALPGLSIWTSAGLRAGGALSELSVRPRLCKNEKVWELNFD